MNIQARRMCKLADIPNLGLVYVLVFILFVANIQIMCRIKWTLWKGWLNWNFTWEYGLKNVLPFLYLLTL